ncbi:hypothetical protein D3C86_2124070 [compost metagenome]
MNKIQVKISTPKENETDDEKVDCNDGVGVYAIGECGAGFCGYEWECEGEAFTG